MAHRPCLLSVHVPSATAGMTSLYDHLRSRGAPTILGCTQQQSQGNSTLGRAPTMPLPIVFFGGGHPQGAPLPIVFSRRLALGRAPTRAPTRGAPTDCLLSAFGPGKGTHKGCPYREGHPQGVPLPIVFSRRFALGRAPTRGAPTDCLLSAFCPGKGTHKGCPYRLSSLGVRPWGGHPQGAPLPIVFSRRFALGRAPTRGAPTDCLLSAFCPGEGTHKGCPYRLFSLGFDPGEGTHKGCPYRLSSLGVLPWGGHPQGVPLLSAFGPGKGTHKGCPYPIQAASRGFSNLMQLP